MLKKILFFLFFSLIVLIFNVNAQTKINGTFPNAKGKTIRLLQYNDLVNRKQVEISSAIIKSDNSFELKTNNKQVTLVFLQMEFFKIEFYAEPNKNYIIQFDTIDINNPKFYPNTVVGFLSPHFTIKNADAHELNNELAINTEILSGFVDENYLKIQRGLKLDSLNKVYNHLYDSLIRESKNPFTQDYLFYQKLQFDILCKKISDDSLNKTVFSGKNIRYDNLPYMDFFISRWNGVFGKKFKNIKSGELDTVFLRKSGLAAFHKVLKKEKIFSDSLCRELAFLINVKFIAKDKANRQEAQESLLTEIIKLSKNESSKKIAQNILAESRMLRKGEKIFDFSMTDLKGNTFTNKDLEGRYTYIYFWTTRNPESVAEIEMIRQKTFDEFDDIINFVTVSLDANPETIEKYFKNNTYKWHVVHYASGIQLLDDFNVEVLPYAILLDRNGKVEQINALLPSQGFSDFFIKMLNNKKGNLLMKDRE